MLSLLKCGEDKLMHSLVSSHSVPYKVLKNWDEKDVVKCSIKVRHLVVLSSCHNFEHEKNLLNTQLNTSESEDRLLGYWDR